MKRSLVDPRKHRSANLTMEGYPPRDWSLSESKLTLPRPIVAVSTRIVLFSYSVFPLYYEFLH